MRIIRLAPLAFLAVAAAPPPAALAPSEIVAAAPAEAWRPIADEDLAIMTLADGRQVMIELAPGFAAAHVANIKALAGADWFAGTSINRVQDNYVVQWGDASEQKPLPPGLRTTTAADYERPLAGLSFDPLKIADPYAPQVGLVAGWPVGTDGRSAWPAHCYGMVGVGRGMPPDAGTGAELYVVIGQAPRHLDRNIAVVGRVVEGLEALTALPRGTGALGFYEQPVQRVAIRSMTLASALPEAERPRFEAFRSDTPAFRAYADARMNRRDAFFIRPAGGADLCNVPAPVRRVKDR